MGIEIDPNSKLGKLVLRYNIKLHSNILIKSEHVKVEEKPELTFKIRHIYVQQLERNRVLNPTLRYARGSLGTLMPMKYLNIEELDFTTLD